MSYLDRWWKDPYNLIEPALTSISTFNRIIEVFISVWHCFVLIRFFFEKYCHESFSKSTKFKSLLKKLYSAFLSIFINIWFYSNLGMKYLTSNYQYSNLYVMSFLLYTFNRIIVFLSFNKSNFFHLLWSFLHWFFLRLIFYVFWLPSVGFEY